MAVEPEKPESEPPQQFTRIVCPWCKGKVRLLRTKPEEKRRYYECEANCNPNDRSGQRTVFGISER